MWEVQCPSQTNIYWVSALGQMATDPSESKVYMEIKDRNGRWIFMAGFRC